MTPALDGIRVLDLSWVYAGPVLTAILGDFGADVIKVESAKRLDYGRTGRPLNASSESGDTGNAPNEIPLFHTLARNKRSICINFGSEAGRDLVRRLVPHCDVVVENFAPGVMDRLGFGYDALRELRSDLVMVSISGMGQTGPRSGRRAYAPTTSAYSGMESLIGYPGEKVLGAMGLNYGDPMVGLWASFALMAALHQRAETGTGAHIDISQMEATACLVGEAFLDLQLSGTTPFLIGNTHPRLAPHGTYPCDGVDSWISLAVASDDEWAALCKAIGDPECVDDARFSSGPARVANAGDLDEIVSAWTRRLDAESAALTLQSAGVAAAPVYSVEDQFSDPHFLERGVFTPVEHPAIGTEWLPRSPWVLSETPGSIRAPAPDLGQHTDEVLTEILGLTSGELDRLHSDDVLT